MIVEQNEAGERSKPSQRALDRRMLPLHVEVVPPVLRHEKKVDGTFTRDLIRDFALWALPRNVWGAFSYDFPVRTRARAKI